MHGRQPQSSTRRTACWFHCAGTLAGLCCCLGSSGSSSKPGLARLQPAISTPCPMQAVGGLPHTKLCCCLDSSGSSSSTSLISPEQRGVAVAQHSVQHPSNGVGNRRHQDHERLRQPSKSACCLRGDGWHAAAIEPRAGFGFCDTAGCKGQAEPAMVSHHVLPAGPPPATVCCSCAQLALTKGAE